MVVAVSPSLHRPAFTSSANTVHSPNPPSPSNINTHPLPSTSSTAPTSPHPLLPQPPLPTSSVRRRSGSGAQSSQHSSSISSPITTSSHCPQSHRTKNSGASALTWKPTRFIVLHERPHSPSTLISSLAPPSLIPMTAAGISVKSSAKSSRKSPAGMKLSMLPSAMSSNMSINASGPVVTPVFTFSTHHQAYAHSLSAQQQLQLHQKEIIHQATRVGIPQHLLTTGPMSPRLMPLGSPGPVTPLALEDGSDGFFASSHGFGHQQCQQLSIVASGQRGGL